MEEQEIVVTLAEPDLAVSYSSCPSLTIFRQLSFITPQLKNYSLILGGKSGI